MIKKDQIVSGLTVKMKKNFVGTDQYGAARSPFLPEIEYLNDHRFMPWPPLPMLPGDIVTFLSPPIKFYAGNIIHVEHNGVKGYMWLSMVKFMEEKK